MSTRAVFDCMVFVQGAARTQSSARRCLELVEDRRIQLFVSPDILDEIREVFSRPRVLRRLPALARDNARQLLDAVQLKATTISRVPIVFQFPRDPKDEPYLNLAIAAEAQFVVTRDRDLLDLMRQDLQADRQFTLDYPSLKIVTPEEFLRLT